MRSTAKQKPLDLQKGLFIIRYESADDPQAPPKVAIEVDPSSASAVEFITSTPSDEAVLWSPGGAVVVRLSKPARLMIEVIPRFEGGSRAARIQSAMLSTDPLGLAWVEAAPPNVEFGSLRVLGHLAGRGDTLVPLNEWLGGPIAPARIEGVGVDWTSRPANFSIRHSVRIGGGASPSELVDAGGFSGTRGRALPIVGVTFEIGGLAAQGYEIVADGLFLGSPQMRVSGSHVVLSGPTGREPLVGLRLQIISNVAVEPQKRDQQASVPAAAPPARGGTGRVRVFRSKASVKS